MRIASIIVSLALACACTREAKQAAKDGGPAATTQAPPAKPPTGTKPTTPPAQEIDIPPPPDVAAPPADAEKTASGLASKVLQPGTGTEKPEEQDSVTVHYTGWTTDGKMFDTSQKRGKPITFPLRSVIKGWTEGVALMVVGEKRRLWIPEELAYKGRSGPQGMLVFDVELVEIKKGPKPIPAPADVKEPPKDAEKLASGLAFKVIEKGTGKAKPGSDDYVKINYTGWTSEGRMLDTSVHRGKPATFPLKATPPGIQEGIAQMVVGEKRRLWIPPKLASRAGKEEGEWLVFDIELVDIVHFEAPADVKGPPKDAQKTASGLASKVLAKGTATTHPKETDRVKVHYTGWTTDGKMFDSSVPRGQPAEFTLSGVIAGWREGVQLMVVGEKRRFWIPEELAYKGKSGPQGMLVFDVELLEIGGAEKNPP